MRKILIVLAGVVLAGALVACSSSDDSEPAQRPDGPTSPAVGEGGLASPTSMPVSEIGSSHVDPPVSFDQSPSIGGDHYPFWQNCGFYEVELIEGAATHTMEHGAIWITYNPDKLSASDLSTLAEMVVDNERLLISPYPHDEPLVLSGWGVQQRGITSVGSPEIDAFISEWLDNSELPEAGVRCTGAAGIPPNDVRSLADGAQVPDEFQ